MVRTSHGIVGKDLGISDKSCIIKSLTNKQIINYLEDNTFRIPDFQRELEIDKVNNIAECFKEKNKSGENYFIHHGFISICKIGDHKHFWIVDGQHRLEAIKLLKDYNFNVLLRIKKCKMIKDMKDDFKLININSKIPISYTYFENEFLQDSVIKVKNTVMKKYKKSFNRNKKQSSRTHKIHINSFIDLLDINKIKILYDNNGIDYGNYYFLLNRLESINNSIKKKFKEYEDKNLESYFINKIDKKIIDETEFYLSLNNIDWCQKLFYDQDIKYNSIKYRKKRIPKKVKMEVLNRDFGNLYIGHCYVCRDTLNRDTAEMGHIIPEWSGGKSNKDNLKSICNKCNLSMGTNNMNEYIQKYYSNNNI